MLQKRTDLAVEARELWEEKAGGTGRLAGVTSRERLREGLPVTEVRILDRRGAEALGKPPGAYLTVDLSPLFRREEDAFSRAARALAAELSGLLHLPPEAPVLVAGLGNRAITPDALGPETADQVLATRHVAGQLPEQAGLFRPVSVLTTGVLGTTGLESGEVVRAVTERIRPACVVAVDALASRNLSRLCTTVQLSDTGLVPGSGIGNARAALDRETLGVPVLSVGVPTVVDAATLACDLLEEAGWKGTDPAALREGSSMIVTTRDIDARISELARVIGLGLNLALQPRLTGEEVQMLLS